MKIDLTVADVEWLKYSVARVVMILTYNSKKKKWKMSQNLVFNLSDWQSTDRWTNGEKDERSNNLGQVWMS